VLQNILDDAFQLQDNLTLATWMSFNVPILLINGTLTGFFLYWYFLWGTKNTQGYKNVSKYTNNKMLRKKYDAHPNLTFVDYVIMILYIGVEIFWFMESPPWGIPGWTNIVWFKQHYKTEGFISRTTLSMALALIFCVFPKNFQLIRDFYKGKDPDGPVRHLIDWDQAVHELHFDVLLFMGGGFALAEGIKKSGLSEYLEKLILTHIPVTKYVAPPFAIIFAAFAAEIIISTPLIQILTPIFINVSKSNKVVHPLIMAYPAGLATAYAFLTPIGNPSIALLTSTVYLRKTDLLKTGIVVKLLCITVMIIGCYTLGGIIFDVDKYP